jgi:hypothetical protein
MAGVFLDLVEQKAYPKVILGIEKAVADSFKEDKKPGQIILVTGPTNRETPREEAKRRAKICIKIFKDLRGDLSWGIDRILDSLPKFLRMELDGVSWEPEAQRASWYTGSR